MAFLASSTFATIVDNTPLISIDLIVRNPLGEVLLGKRVNAPAKGYWFTPGGRIYKNEKMAEAFERIVHDETGLDLKLSAADFIGTFEHFYPDSVFGSHITTHYVVLAYTLHADLALSDLPRAQHGEYRWVSVDDLLSDESVHTHVKWYFTH